MYDIKKAMRKMRPLVRQMARKHAVSGNIRMSRKDLESEGMLVLIRCCQKFSSGNFEHYFARAFLNYIGKLRAYGNREMRQGVEIPIEMLEPIKSRDGYKDSFLSFALAQAFIRKRNEQSVLEDLQSRATRLIPLLSFKAVRLVQMTTDPLHTAEVEEQAYNEYLRKKHLRALGIRCPGRVQFRVKKRHFQKALGISKSEMRSVIREIQSVDSILQKGGNRWPRKEGK